MSKLYRQALRHRESQRAPPGMAQLTSWLLEAVAPLVVGKLAVLEGVAGVEERFDTRLVLVQVNGTDLRGVQQQVIVHVKLVEHPA